MLGYVELGCARFGQPTQDGRGLVQRAWNSAKRRARLSGIAFDISQADLLATAVDACPVLGIPLAYARTNGRLHDGSPTVDRIRNERGYIRDNIVVISFRANAIKRNASLAELEAVVDFYRGILDGNH